MLGISGVDIVEAVRNYVEKIVSVFVELWFWPVIFLGLMILAVIVLGTLVKKSYENKILKSVNKLNKYFLSKPFITEENLVEFNLKMKKVPKVLRNNWQIYMLNREDAPTKYINVDTCIDKPLKTGSIEKNMQNFTTFTILLSLLAFIAGLKYAGLTQNQFLPIMFYALLVPTALAIIYTITILAVRASKNDIYACLYENFPLYERNLTKAVSTLPAYVDYEILFTRKEIKEGIPILQQYLEKRALVEQQELEKARENSVAVEQYDFSDLGVDGSLILERSMKESETFINIRRRLQNEINSIETEMSNYKKNYEETLKDMQRKLQASRENLESLKVQQEESTNRIESNYIRKQQADEIKKQQQLEKDIEEATTKFTDEQTSLQQDIDKREKEIAEKKEFVEQAMELEFKHYANTLYKALTEKATEVGNQRLLTLAQENSDLKALLTDIQGVGGANVDIQNDLIQNQELTGENLYDMSTNDINQLDESRAQSEINAQEEAQKMEEQAQEEKTSQPIEQQTENSQEKVNQVDDQNISNQHTQDVANDENDQTVENSNQVNENIQDETQQNEVQNNMMQNNMMQNQNVVEQNNFVEQDNRQDPQYYGQNQQANVSQNNNEQDVNENLNYQQQNVQYQNVSNQNMQYQSPQGEDLEQIQRQIDENNEILQRNKQEFEKDLNKTISKIDDDNDEDDDEYEYEEPIRRHEVVREEREERESRPARRRRASYEDEYESTTRKKRATSRRIVDDEPRRSGRRTTTRSRRELDTSSDFDELNAEMQKLLNNKN